MSLAAALAGPGPGAIEKERFAADARHDHRFARIDHSAGDALADFIAPPLYFLLGQAVGDVYGYLPLFLVQQADGAQTHFQAIAEQFENVVQSIFELGGRSQDLATLVEHGDLALGNFRVVSRRHGGKSL